MTRESIKISINLPEELLGAVEREIERSKESLDDFFRRAVELLLAQRRDQEMSNQY